MAVSTPTLNSKSLPVPTDYSEETFGKSSTTRMASGALVRDVVSAGIKRRFRLGWTYIDDTARNLVHTAMGDVIDGTSRTFLAPTGTSYTVVLAENGDPDWEGVTVRGTAFRWSGTLVLEEV